MSFWQFTRERWFWIVLLAVGWGVLWLWVLRLPPWVGIGLNVGIWLWIAYQLGVLRTQARWMHDREREMRKESAELDAIFREAAGLRDRGSALLEHLTERRH